MRLHRYHVSTIAIATVLALALAACGGGSDDGSETPLGTSTLTSRDGALIPTATPYARLPEPTIVSGVAAGAPSTELTYVVEPGDSLSLIAELYETTVEEIVALNGIDDPTQIFVGQELLIPTGTLAASPEAPADESTDDAATNDATTTDEATDDDGTDDSGTDSGGTVLTYEVQPGDTALGIAFAFDVTIDDLAAANGTTIEALNNLAAGDVLNIPS